MTFHEIKICRILIVCDCFDMKKVQMWKNGKNNVNKVFPSLSSEKLAGYTLKSLVEH